MRLPLPLRRAAIRCAYVGLRVYWFVFRPRVEGVKCILTCGDDVLLVRHAYGSRSWDFPGGTVKRRELAGDAARREMHEELGRSYEEWDDLGELFVNTNHHLDNLHLFQARVPDRRVDINLTELSDASWFARDALPGDLGPYVGVILRRVRRS